MQNYGIVAGNLGKRDDSTITTTDKVSSGFGVSEDNNTIYTDEIISDGASKNVVTEEVNVEGIEVPAGYKVYYAKEGDTFSSLANKYGISKKELKSVNNDIDGEISKDDVVYVPEKAIKSEKSSGGSSGGSGGNSGGGGSSGGGNSGDISPSNKEYEKITLHNLSIKYYLAGQISICFLHILKMINHISLIGEEVDFNSQDLKKYFVKFSYYDIFSAKINFIYELNIEKPFSGNCLNSVEVEKNEYILDDFDEYRKNTINIIWKYFNPKDVKINYNYFYNMSLMLNYLDKVKVFKNEFSDEYVFNVMQGNIKPKEIEFESDEMNKFDTLEL